MNKPNTKPKTFDQWLNVIRSPEYAGKVIDALGGTNAVARIFNIRPSSVSGWRDDGIPHSRIMYLGLKYKRVLKSIESAGIGNCPSP